MSDVLGSVISSSCLLAPPPRTHTFNIEIEREERPSVTNISALAKNLDFDS